MTEADRLPFTPRSLPVTVTSPPRVGKPAGYADPSDATEGGRYSKPMTAVARLRPAARAAALFGDAALLTCQNRQERGR
jgi:hypothetical protein